MSRNFVCADCGGKLELGIIVDHADKSLPMDASYWMEGSNEKIRSGWLNENGKKKHYISALRCVTCGLLKFYAGPDTSESK
jgi:hypothetical protein